jgi:hypothetical protein
MLGNLGKMCRYAWNNGITSMINVIGNASYIQMKQYFQKTIIRSSNLKGEDEEHYS